VLCKKHAVEETIFVGSYGLWMRLVGLMEQENRNKYLSCRRRRRRRRRGGRPATDIATDAPADFTEDATASTTTHCFLELDPLAVALCDRADPPARLILVNPMLDELAALLVTSRLVAAQAPGCLSPEGQASLWDPTSTAPQCTTDRDRLRRLPYGARWRPLWH
jgi:hypothetical protein